MKVSSAEGAASALTMSLVQSAASTLYSTHTFRIRPDAHHLIQAYHSDHLHNTYIGSYTSREHHFFRKQQFTRRDMDTMDWFDELPSDMDPTGWLDEVPSERDVLVDPSSSPPSTDADPISGRQGEGGTQPIQPRGSPSVHDTNAVIPAQDVAYPLRGTDTRFDPNEDLPTLAEDVFNMISDEEHADADRLWAEALQEAEERRFGLSLNVETQPAARDVREQGAVADTPMSPRYAIADELPLDIPQPQVNAEPRAGDALFVPGEVWFAAPAVETHPEHTRSENPPLGYEDTLVRDTEPGAGDTLVMAGEILAAPTRSPSGPLPPAPNDTQVQDVDPEAGASLVELENLSPRPSPAQGLGPPQAALAQRHTPRLRYSHLTEQEREILESHYQEDPKSDQWTKQRLADMLGFSLQKVKVCPCSAKETSSV